MFCMDDLRNQIESILFACGRKIGVDEIRVLVGELPIEVIKEKLDELKQVYNERNSPLMVLEENDGWKLTAREKYLKIVQKINPHTELSKTIMETLAVIAWKQPIMQSEVINIRTNKAYEHIDELERIGFIIKEKFGRTFVLKLSQKFFDYFDLSDANAARELFREIQIDEELQKKMDEFREEELAKNIEDQKSTEDQEEDVYNKNEREQMVEDAEVEPQEAAFVEGYEESEEKEHSDAEKDEIESENDAETDENVDKPVDKE